MKKLLAISIVALFTFFIFAEPTFAQTLLRNHNCLYQPAGGGGEILTIQCLIPLFANIIYWLIIFSGTVALFIVMFGGFKYLTSGGDPKSVEGARKTLTWAIIGLVVILSSFLILNAIAQLTGVNCITQFGFTSCGEEHICDSDHPTGYCTDSRADCTRTNGGMPPIYQCVIHCDVAKSSSGWCEEGSCTAEATPYGVTYWSCK